MDGRIGRSATSACDLIDLYRSLAEQSGDHHAKAAMRRIEASLKLIAGNTEIGRVGRNLNRES